MYKFIKYELKYWLSTPMTWIFLIINALLIMGAVSSDSISIGGGTGSVHKNAPSVIQNYYGVMSLICLLMTTAFMNATANRDFQYGMYQFIFSSPIKKRDYYFGKFIGATIVAVIPLLGVSLGTLIGPLMPWAQPERYGEVIWSGHLMGLLTFGIPNTIITGVFLYALAIIFRNNIVSFVGAMLMLVLYSVSSGFLRDIEKEWLVNILDPFGFRPLSLIGKYMTVNEKNLHPIYLTGGLLLNRLIWIGFSLCMLIVLYFRFSFNTKKEKKKKTNESKEKQTIAVINQTIFVPKASNQFNASTFWNLIVFETKAIIKNPTFIIIVILGFINLAASLTQFTGRYGTDQYPVTYEVIDTIRGAFYLFLIAVITFYSGVLVWKERDSKISEIQDATPIKTGLLFSSKLIAVIISVALIMVLNIVIGVITQSLYGYYRFQLDVYAKSLLVIDLLGFSFLIVIALFFHYLINNRYIAYFAFIAFVILNQFIWGVFKISTNLVKFGNTPSVTYSDMNGFGPFIKTTVWFNIYWLIGSAIVALITFAFYTRGKEATFTFRLKTARLAIKKNVLLLLCLATLFVICGGFIYYNTIILNKFNSSEEAEQNQINYEKKYKKFENMPIPSVYKMTYAIDIFPTERNMIAHVDAWAKNTSTQPINELHFTMPTLSDSLVISMKDAKLKMRDETLGYRIYSLAKAILPGDSFLIHFDSWNLTKGFENEVSFTQLTQNGTFFNNADLLPIFGYSEQYEIADKNKRIKFKLPRKIRSPKLDENDMKNRSFTYLGNNANWVDVETTISTSKDQTAIAPGSLIKQWEQNGRNYFHYKLDHTSLNFYSFISAQYQIARKQWNGISLEVYYDKNHAYNVPNMLKSMQKSLEYYTQHYGPYYHKQCRIIEFPRYAGFAQAFPGTMPYSESIGFIVDLRKVTADDIDQVFYVVAHEMGHQYWAHQVCGANMQGSEMMSEGFAQYSALMVMEKEYGKDKMKKFLKYEMDGYLAGRSREFEAERPLMKTEGQGYIHYQKASVVMYYLKEMIGEEKVNQALRSLVDSFGYKPAPFPVSINAVNAFKKVIPDSLQYLIADLFENITLFSNRILTANYKKKGNEYEVTFTTKSEKFRADSLGKETALPIADYIDIGVFAEPANKKNLGKALVYERVKLTKGQNSFVFTVKNKPYQVGIDPYNYLIDRIPDDNLKKLSGE